MSFQVSWQRGFSYCAMHPNGCTRLNELNKPKSLRTATGHGFQFATGLWSESDLNSRHYSADVVLGGECISPSACESMPKWRTKGHPLYNLHNCCVTPPSRCTLNTLNKLDKRKVADIIHDRVASCRILPAIYTAGPAEENEQEIPVSLLAQICT